ncbi:MAG TPA: ribosome assembly factor SBDS [archaeon]|nr:ribosome assembly factor SBDS [archaeon]
MVSVDEAVIAKIRKENTDFEILVDPEKALEFKKGKPYSIENILAANLVFKDSKKGERASTEDLKKAFKTTDILKISEIIIREGTVQLTTEQRRKLTEEKRLEIASIISKQGVDPKTHNPHPQQRILNAMAEVRVDIDPFKSAKDQIKEIIEEIQTLIPISFEKVTVAIRVPADQAGRVGHAIRELATIESEEWKADYWFIQVTISAGLQTQLYDKINSLTQGRVETKIVKREAV